METLWVGEVDADLGASPEGKRSPCRSSDGSRNSASTASLRFSRVKVPQAGDLTGQGILSSLKTGSTKIGAARPSTRP